MADDGWRRNDLSEFEERVNSVLCHFEFDVGFREFRERTGEFGEILDESSVITGETEKRADRCNILGHRIIPDRIEFSWIGESTVGVDDVAKEIDFGFHELAFLRSDFDAIFDERLECGFKSEEHAIHGLGRDAKIVDVTADGNV